MHREISVIKNYCDELGWTHEEKSESVMSAEVPGDEGSRKTVWVVFADGVIEISVQSGFAVDEEDDFPGIVSTMLLNLNSKMDYGFWCLESLGGKTVASVMHNQAPEDLDGATFRKIATKAVTACESFESAMASNFADL